MVSYRSLGSLQNFYIFIAILCTASLLVQYCVSPVQHPSVLPLPFVFLHIATQSVRFVLPSAFFFHNYVFLIVIFLLISVQQLLFVTGAFPFRRPLYQRHLHLDNVLLQKQNGNQKFQQPITQKRLKIPKMTFYGRRHFLFRVESGPTLTFVI